MLNMRAGGAQRILSFVRARPNMIAGGTQTYPLRHTRCGARDDAGSTQRILSFERVSLNMSAGKERAQITALAMPGLNAVAFMG